MSNGPKNTGQFGKGNPGKPKGAVNKTTKALKDMILGALDKAGGEDYLLEQAHNNPGAFLTLIGKVLPQDIKASVTTTLTQRVVEVPKDE